MDLGACAEPAPAAGETEPLDDAAFAHVTKALGNPTRVKIFRLLTERQTCVTGELVAELPLAQSTISEHLRILREANLIQGEIEGPRTSYCINQQVLAAFKRTVLML
ncbi:helix-turn-helix transcriptional regulator [Ferrimicrobium sp.]|nr:metalloregulator ArsR/SmtB family transcription factor [Ferrimicrobium sp.]